MANAKRTKSVADLTNQAERLLNQIGENDDARTQSRRQRVIKAYDKYYKNIGQTKSFKAVVRKSSKMQGIDALNNFNKGKVRQYSTRTYTGMTKG